MIEIVELTLGDAPEAWRAAGFTVVGGRCAVGHVELVLTGAGGGVRGWRVRGVPAVDSIDGIPTEVVDTPLAEPAGHPNGVGSIDHVVIMTPDCDRTVGAFRALGDEPRRERVGGPPGRPVRQVFVRAGEVILEIVGPVSPARRDVSASPPSAAASIWGLACTVADLDASAAFLGPDGCGTARAAVQEGRRIATLRHEHFGIGVPIVLMSRGGGQSRTSTAGA